jgi:tripartite-type tricarboxylate transporter receptor subunit TctC
MTYLQRFLLLSVLAPGFNLSLCAQENWPSKPIHLVIPFSAGGVQDGISRSISNELAEVLGQPLIIDNRVGAGGTIGTSYVAKSQADGYTMVFAATNHNINGTLYTKLNYHPIKDFTAVAQVGKTSYILAISSSLPSKTLDEFIALAKSNPGQFNYSSAGIGSSSHLGMAYFNVLAGLNLVHIPLKGTGDAMNELLSGRVQALIGANNVILPFASDPRIRLIGVTSERPSPYVPGVPAIGVSVKGFAYDSWIGFLAPNGVSKPILDKLYKSLNIVLKRPDVVERLIKEGVEIQPLGAEEFNQVLRTDFDKMAKVVQISGARID